MLDRQPVSARSIKVAARDDGSLLYLVPGAPSGLPPVRKRDLLAAWDDARQLADQGEWGAERCFRFVQDDAVIDIALTDADARSWVAAVDARAGLQTRYGLSLGLRLLALIDLVSHAPGARHLVSVSGGEAALHPALVEAASAAPLNDEARFDHATLLAGLARAWQSLPRPTGSTA